MALPPTPAPESTGTLAHTEGDLDPAEIARVEAFRARLTRKPWVKTSLAPGSKVVTDYLKACNLLDDLDKDTVNFQENYDGTRSEPSVMPAMKSWVVVHDLALVLMLLAWARRRGVGAQVAIAYAWNPANPLNGRSAISALAS